MTDNTTSPEAIGAHCREMAYQAYINEGTENGNTRIDNILLSLPVGDKIARHVATQIDLAFQAGWFAARELIPALSARVPDVARLKILEDIISKIASCESHHPQDVVAIARAVIEVKP